MTNIEHRKIQSFTDLTVWQISHQLALTVYKLVRSFPKMEQYALADQMRRAAVSVGSNVAEGFTRTTFKDKANFYRLAKASLTELHSQLLLCKDLGYCNDGSFLQLVTLIERVSRLLHAFIRKTQSFIR